jgi:hypothetical protein
MATGDGRWFVIYAYENGGLQTLQMGRSYAARSRELWKAVHLNASEDRTDLFGGPVSATSRRHAGVGEMRSDGGERRTASTHGSGFVHDLDLARLRIETTISIAPVAERHGTERPTL